MATQIGENVAQVVQQIFAMRSSNVKCTKEKYEWTVLAGLVLEKDNKFECVSFATGTRAVPDQRVDNLNPGCALADCHAEVLCRRAFLRFCLDQMNELKNGRNSKIFEKSMSEEGKFEIKPDVKLHFYTSSLPCGDCQIHEMIIDQSEENSDGPPEKKIKILESFVSSRVLAGEIDYHRTGAKPVPGTNVPEDTLGNIRGLARTKGGRGPPSSSMSCSDKISKWIAFGLQARIYIYIEREQYEKK